MSRVNRYVRSPDAIAEQCAQTRVKLHQIGKVRCSIVVHQTFPIVRIGCKRNISRDFHGRIYSIRSRDTRIGDGDRLNTPGREIRRTAIESVLSPETRSYDRIIAGVKVIREKWHSRCFTFANNTPRKKYLYFKYSPFSKYIYQLVANETPNEIHGYFLYILYRARN